MKFSARAALLAAPLGFLTLTYVVWDPFQVLRPKSDYYVNCHVEPDRDWVSTQVYLANAGARKYDSFVFGSSRSLAFFTEDWRQILPDIRPFHYDAANESLFGVWSKFRFLDARDQPIRHALIFLDADLLKNTKNLKSHLFIKHPAISGGNWAEFHLTMFAAYFQKLFFARYIDYRLFGTYRACMKGLIHKRPIAFTLPSNDKPFPLTPPRIADPEANRKNRAYLFPPRESIRKSDGSPVITPEAEAMLKDVRAVLDRRQSDWKIVVNPLYDQVALNRVDLHILQNIFGAERVYDFSGSTEFTKDTNNYDDVSHFSRIVGREILRRIYAS